MYPFEEGMTGDVSEKIFLEYPEFMEKVSEAEAKKISEARVKAQLERENEANVPETADEGVPGDKESEWTLDEEMEDKAMDEAPNDKMMDEKDAVKKQFIFFINFMTLADLKLYLGITDSANDDLLQSFLNAATAFVEKYIGRAIYSDSREEFFDGNGQKSIILKNYPLYNVVLSENT